jgi:hypothetical protein
VTSSRPPAEASSRRAYSNSDAHAKQRARCGHAAGAVRQMWPSSWATKPVIGTSDWPSPSAPGMLLVVQAQPVHAGWHRGRHCARTLNPRPAAVAFCDAKQWMQC